MGTQYRPLHIYYNNTFKDAVGIIDSGADTTIISKQLAKNLHIDLTSLKKTIETYTVTGERKILKAVIVKVEERWYDKAATIEVGVSDDFFDPSQDGHGIHVILGVDFLQETNYELKFST